MQLASAGEVLGYEPHGEVKDIFIVRHTSVTDFEHVQVVPSARLGFTRECSYFVDNVHDTAVKTGESAVVCRTRASVIGAIKRVVNIAGNAPGVSHCLSPVPGRVFAPIAHGIQDGTTCHALVLGQGLVLKYSYQ